MTTGISGQLNVQVLASGSSGNAILVQADRTRLLVDAGISHRRIQRCLRARGHEVEQLDAILVTHEHGDHVAGLELIQRRYPELPVHATRGTARGYRRRYRRSLTCKEITPGQAVRVGSFQILPFSISHDAGRPVGYRLSCGGFHMAVVTDLGEASDELTELLRPCQLLIVESNHDEQMLQTGPYPWHLKRRIASSRGHLSNRQAAALIAQLAHPGLQQIVLAHLSAKNNSPQKAVESVSPVLASYPNARLTTADRHDPGPVFSFQIDREVQVPVTATCAQLALPFG